MKTTFNSYSCLTGFRNTNPKTFFSGIKWVPPFLYITGNNPYNSLLTEKKPHWSFDKWGRSTASGLDSLQLPIFIWWQRANLETCVYLCLFPISTSHLVCLFLHVSPSLRLCQSFSLWFNTHFKHLPYVLENLVQDDTQAFTKDKRHNCAD